MKNRLRRGVTIVELLVAAAALSVVIGAVFFVLQGGQKIFGNISTGADLQTRAGMVLEQLARDIKYSNHVEWDASTKNKIRLRIDKNSDPTPEPDDDETIEYRQVGGELRLYPEILSKPNRHRVITKDVQTADFMLNGNLVAVKLEMERENKEISLSTSITLRNAADGGEAFKVLYVYK